MVHTGAVHHLSFSVQDYELSKKFYQNLLVDLLGYIKIMEQPYCTMWTHPPSGTSFCISPGTNVPHHKSNPGIHHLALAVETRSEIDELYKKIVQFQSSIQPQGAYGAILDAPADYPQYAPGYYAVFFTDPDGIKLELAHTPGVHAPPS
ncbi:hypothetical protein BGW38_004036 [Lunasporangiospora selenospora]|uniref:VOC domain-containing protein n=1 Tax=Lunasporangiospora selenospora TaxID=979761 RepID=A0A9P6G081_9FUNG|nr:hypothetical protein BGW38_004036 [Lunasporangiospora selenospora]